MRQSKRIEQAFGRDRSIPVGDAVAPQSPRMMLDTSPDAEVPDGSHTGLARHGENSAHLARKFKAMSICDEQT